MVIYAEAASVFPEFSFLASPLTLAAASSRTFFWLAILFSSAATISVDSMSAQNVLFSNHDSATQ